MFNVHSFPKLFSTANEIKIKRSNVLIHWKDQSYLKLLPMFSMFDVHLAFPKLFPMVNEIKIAHCSLAGMSRSVFLTASYLVV